MTKPYATILLFEFIGISLDTNYQKVINLLFVLPGLYFSILKTEKILQFFGANVLDVCGTSFQRKRLKILK